MRIVFLLSGLIALISTSALANCFDTEAGVAVKTGAFWEADTGRMGPPDKIVYHSNFSNSQAGRLLAEALRDLRGDTPEFAAPERASVFYIIFRPTSDLTAGSFDRILRSYQPKEDKRIELVSKLENAVDENISFYWAFDIKISFSISGEETSDPEVAPARKLIAAKIAGDGINENAIARMALLSAIGFGDFETLTSCVDYDGALSARAPESVTAMDRAMFDCASENADDGAGV